MKILRNILWAVTVYNIIAASAFLLLPAGYMKYMPEWLASMFFAAGSMYSMFGICPVSMICSAVMLFMVIYKAVKKIRIEKNNIALLVINLLGIPWGWFLFMAGMSV